MQIIYIAKRQLIVATVLCAVALGLSVLVPAFAQPSEQEIAEIEQDLITLANVIDDNEHLLSANIAEGLAPVFGKLEQNENRIYKFSTSKDSDLKLRILTPRDNLAEIHIGIIEPTNQGQIEENSQFRFRNIIIPGNYNRQFQTINPNREVELVEIWGEEFNSSREFRRELMPGQEYYLLLNTTSPAADFVIVVDENYTIDPVNLWGVKTGFAFGKTPDWFGAINALLIGFGIIANLNVQRRIRPLEQGEQTVVTPNMRISLGIYWAILVINIAYVAATSLSGGINPFLLAGLFGNSVAMGLGSMISDQTPVRNRTKRIALNISLVFWLLNIILVSL